MAIIESTPRRLALGYGNTKLTLDKDAGKATLQRKLLFWNLKPAEMALSDISSVTLDKMVDRASSVEVYHAMLVTRGGAAWALPANDKAEAEKNIAAMKNFLALQS